MAATFQCKLVTPEAQLLDEPLVYASIPGWDGQVGIAPSRAPLLVKLGAGLLRLEYPDSAVRTYFVGGGFAQMKDNVLTLLAGQCEPSDEIDADVARQALSEASARVPVGDEAIEQRLAEQAEARARLAATGR